MSAPPALLAAAAANTHKRSPTRNAAATDGSPAKRNVPPCLPGQQQQPWGHHQHHPTYQQHQYAQQQQHQGWAGSPGGGQPGMTSTGHFAHSVGGTSQLPPATTRHTSQPGGQGYPVQQQQYPQQQAWGASTQQHPATGRQAPTLYQHPIVPKVTSAGAQPYHHQQQQQQQFWPHQKQQPALSQHHHLHLAADTSSSPGGPGTPPPWRPSIWPRVRGSLQHQAWIAAGNVTPLSRALGEPAYHVRHEVSRLQAWQRLTFWLRLVLEQFDVLEFVSEQTLRRLPTTPPEQLQQLDAWLQEDAAAYNTAAATAAAAGCSTPPPPTHSAAAPQPTLWATMCGCREEPDPRAWKLRPSCVILHLLARGRLTWVPHAGPASAAGTARGQYQWRHGPPDAYLSTDPADKQQRAEQLLAASAGQHYYRNHAKLLLGCTASNAGRGGGSRPRSLFGSPSTPPGPTVEWRFLDATHAATCHLQRHPVLGAHERLVKLSVDRSSSSSSSSGSTKAASAAASQRAAAEAVASQQLQDALNHGVMLAGRLYRRLVQKEVGQAGESLWLLAVESVADEDMCGPHAWPATNPAAARQALGGFSSLASIPKQSARPALLVSNSLPLKVPARMILYIPDVCGPTDAQGRQQQLQALPGQLSGGGPAAATASSAAVLTDGSGFISADLAGLVPAVAAGELLAAHAGQGVKWPHTPLQVRLFDPHFGGVVAKGMLLPLNGSALPPGTVVLRSSQVKAPASEVFARAWQQHWQRMLAWAHQQHQQQHHEQEELDSALAASRAVEAAAQAASPGPRAALLRCFNAQDQPWMQQLWYVHDALQLHSLRQRTAPNAATAAAAVHRPPPAPCAPSAGSGCPHQTAAGSGSSGCRCSCSAVLEVVTRPPDGVGRGELRINKNLLLLLHQRGVPAQVFEEWLAIAWHKTVNIDSSYASALAAAREAAATDVVHKLEALCGMQPLPDCTLQPLGAAAGVPGSGAAAAALAHGWPPSPAAAAAAAAAAAGNDRGGDSSAPGACSLPPGVVVLGGRPYAFRPDLALKQELRDIALKRRSRLANLVIPVPTPADIADAAAAGAAVLPGGAAASAAAAGDPGVVGTAASGVQLFGLPDPTCGTVPQGCVAVRSELVPAGGRAVLYRHPGIHPGDVRRVRVIAYPPELLALLPEGAGGAMFLPSVGAASLASQLAGGDYDGDLFLLLWEPRVVAAFFDGGGEDAAPFEAPSGGASWGNVAEGAGWQAVEEQLTHYYEFCRRVAGQMGQAHTLWELLADRYGADHMHCVQLAGIYYRALDAPKTGATIRIPDQLAVEASDGLPAHHSVMVKQAARAALLGSGSRSSSSRRGSYGSSSQRPWRHPSKIIRPLFLQVKQLPPLDVLDPALLVLDPDLVLQEGPAAEVPVGILEAYITKWTRLHAECWARPWRQLLNEVADASSSSRAAASTQQASKQDLRLALAARLESELWTDADGNLPQWGCGPLGASSSASALVGPVSSSSTAAPPAFAGPLGGRGLLATPMLFVNASAAYQAVYRLAQDKQQRLAGLTSEERTRRAEARGYEDVPRVAGQWLRLLKVSRAVILQDATMHHHQQWHDIGAATAALLGGNVLGTPPFSLRRRADALQLGSLQHPLLAELQAWQQPRLLWQRGGAAAAAAAAAGARACEDEAAALHGLCL